MWLTAENKMIAEITEEMQFIENKDFLEIFERVYLWLNSENSKRTYSIIIKAIKNNNLNNNLPQKITQTEKNLVVDFLNTVEFKNLLKDILEKKFLLVKLFFRWKNKEDSFSDFISFVQNKIIKKIHSEIGYKKNKYSDIVLSIIDWKNTNNIW